MKHAFVGFSRSWVTSAVVALAATASVQASTPIYDTFESGSVLSNVWSLSSGVVVTNQPQLVNSNSPNFMYIPAGGTAAATNTVDGRKVWVDFYTKPMFFQSDLGPGVDSNLTAFFYANTNGDWVTVSGSNGTLVTHTWTNGLIPGLIKADTNAWSHVAVCQDFTNRVWSLFVNEIPVATNLGFISNNMSFARFETKNFGVSGPVYLDNVLVSNFMSVVSATNDVASNGVPPSVALQYFGVVDPWPVTTNVDAVGDSGVTLKFENIAPEVTYIVMRGAAPTISGMQSNGVVANASGVFVDANALSTVGSRAFYKLISVSRIDPSVSTTNDETYVAYRQDRSRPNTYYWVGVPINYGTNNTLDGLLGQQLARGLNGGTSDQDSDSVTIYNPSNVTAYLRNGRWYYNPLDALSLATNAVPPGSGLLLRRITGSGTSAVLAGLAPTNNTVSLGVNSNWNFLSWPYNSSNSVWGLSTNIGLAGTAYASDAAEIWLYKNGETKRLRLWSDNKWHEYVTGATPTAGDWWYYLHPGDAFFLKSSSGVTWTP